MATGTVDFFNDTGGYGFIETEDADDDVFFHMEDVGGPDLEEGQELEFEIEDSPKGPRATNVVRLSGADRFSLAIRFFTDATSTSDGALGSQR